MALILSLDSTTALCSAAIHKEGILLDAETDYESRTAASKLAVLVKNLLNRNKIAPQNLDSVAISSGPGSYTGLRIATSTAKGICMAIEKPLLAVSSLQVLANQVVNKVNADLFCPMIDARRMEVYCALFNSDLELKKTIEAKVLDERSFSEELNSNKIAFFGDGSTKFRSLTNHKNSIFVESINPNAGDLGYLAFERFKNNAFEDLENFEPYYLKDFILKK